MNTTPITNAAVRNRRHQCKTCPTQCEPFQVGTLDHTQPEIACPLPKPRFGPWSQVKQSPPIRIGLGDVVAAVAQPIAKAIDAVAGTNLSNCGGCTGPGGRKDQLNQVVPDVLHPLAKKPDET